MVDEREHTIGEKVKTRLTEVLLRLVFLQAPAMRLDPVKRDEFDRILRSVAGYNERESIYVSWLLYELRLMRS